MNTRARHLVEAAAPGAGDSRVTSTAFLYGYYGQRNTGDDVFALVTAWAARRLLGCEDVWTAADSVPDGAAARPMLLSYANRGATRLNPLVECIRVRHGGRVIFGGGSNFHDASRMEAWRRRLRWAGRHEHFAAGVGVGPFCDQRAERECRRLLQELAFVGVRDGRSFERARGLAPHRDVRLTFDLAPLIEQAAGLPTPAVPRARGHVGVALARGGVRPKTIAAIAEGLRRYVRHRTVARVVLIDFNGHPRKGDAAAHRAIARALGDDIEVVHEGYNPNPLVTFTRVAALDVIVGMRLHAAVFGFCTRTPTLIVGYHEKCFGWAEMIGAPRELVIDVRALDAEWLASALAAATDRRLAPSLAPEQAAAAAISNWTWAAGSAAAAFVAPTEFA
jgi:polysaccharide pyruvyl transferase WcaK-like protein